MKTENTLDALIKHMLDRDIDFIMDAGDEERMTITFDPMRLVEDKLKELGIAYNVEVDSAPPRIYLDIEKSSIKPCGDEADEKGGVLLSNSVAIKAAMKEHNCRAIYAIPSSELPPGILTLKADEAEAMRIAKKRGETVIRRIADHKVRGYTPLNDGLYCALWAVK